MRATHVFFSPYLILNYNLPAELGPRNAEFYLQLDTFLAEDVFLQLLHLDGDISRLCSHWPSSYITALSLVEIFIVMKYFHSYATPAP